MIVAIMNSLIMMMMVMMMMKVKKVAVLLMLLMIMFRRCFSDEGQDLGEMDLSSVTKLLLSNVPV